MQKTAILTPTAPKPIGTYSQATRAGNWVFISAQAPLVPDTMEVVAGGVDAQIRQSFTNLVAIVQAAGGATSNIVKITVFLTDLSNFPKVNQIMEQMFQPPFPARAAVGVAALPRSTAIAVEAIMAL